MEYKYEHIEAEEFTPEQIKELARIFAEIIYREMINGRAQNEDEEKMPTMVRE